MNKYKPEFMGKVIPADDPAKLTDFVTNKYEAFSKVYETCKEQAEKIENISVASSDNASPDTLSVKVSTDSETMSNIQEAAKKDDSVSVSGDVVTATGESKK